MRAHSLSLGVAALVALAPALASAGDPESDKLIYDAFQKHLTRVPAEKRAEECANFLQRYGDNRYAPEVMRLYQELSGKPYQPAGDSSLPPGGDPAAEAAAVVGGAESEAAAALGGENPPAAPTRVPPGPAPDGLGVAPPPVDTKPLRRPQSFALGADISLSALIGPGISLSAVPRNPHWNISAALRVPALQASSLHAEVRYLFSPDRTFTGYLGGGLGAIYGDIDPVIRLVSAGNGARDVEEGGFVWGAVAGVQKATSDRTAWFLEASYQILSFTEVDRSSNSAIFPGVNFGYLFFIR